MWKPISKLVPALFCFILKKVLRIRQGWKKPGFKKKPSPVVFFVFCGFFGFFWFFGVFLGFFALKRGV
jgi:hypothetical protein